MPRWKCWWLWGLMSLVGGFAQAEEGFWPREEKVSSPAQRPGPPSKKYFTSHLGLPALVPEASWPNRPSFQDSASSHSQQNSQISQVRSISTSPAHFTSSAKSSGSNSFSSEMSGQRNGSGRDSPGSESARGDQLRLGKPQPTGPLSAGSVRPVDPKSSTLTVLSSLAVVLGVFLLLVWAIRRAMPRPIQLLPSDVVEVLGRAPLLGKQQMYLVRCGPKLLLISVSPEGAEPLTEIDHPDEVARIIALCRQAQPGSIPASFRQLLDQMARPARAKSSFDLMETSGASSPEAKGLPEEEPAHV